MAVRQLPVLALALVTTPPVAATATAQVRVPIASRPPAFRIYDIDKRERRMHALIAELAGHRGMSRQQAANALGELDRIRRQEDDMRARHGGQLTVAAVRTVDAQLNALSHRLGLRETRN